MSGSFLCAPLPSQIYPGRSSAVILPARLRQWLISDTPPRNPGDGIADMAGTRSTRSFAWRSVLELHPDCNKRPGASVKDRVKALGAGRLCS